MKLDKIKEIIGIIVWALLIFMTQKLMISTSSNGIVYCILLAPWVWGGLLGAAGAITGAMAGGLAAGAAVSYFGGMGGRAKVKHRDTWRVRHAADEKKRSRDELRRWQNMYSNLSMSNPYVNMENKMEDLTINQEQIQFQRQAFQQSQKNILSSLRQGVGAGGVASLAQSLVRQGEQSEQQIAANVAQQEADNRILALQQRERLQRLEAEGKGIETDFRAQQLGAMMGMTQQEYEMNKDLQQQYYGVQMNQASTRIQSNLSAFNTLLGSMPG